MTPDDAKNSYRQLLTEHGELVTLRRFTGTGSPPSHTDYPSSGGIRARVRGYKPEELVGGIVQGDSEVILLAEDVTASAITLPLVAGANDWVVIRSKQHIIKRIDDNTRRIADELIAYQLTVG